MSKAFIGGLCGSISTPPSFEPISKVVVMLDDENAYTAGDDTGREIRVPCPYGTQEMANKLLAQLSGYKYQPVSAEDALIDPAAELGDAITAGGVYTVYAEQDMEFDHMMAVDVSAPGEEELLPEYSYQSPMQQINYKIAKTRSLITKSTEEVLIKVEGTDGKGGLAGQVASLSTKVDNIKLSVSNGTSSSTLKLMSGSTELSSAEIKITGMVTFSELGAAPGASATKINGGWIDADTLTVRIAEATTLTGGFVGIKNAYNYEFGAIYASMDTTGSPAVQMHGLHGLRLTSAGNVYLECSISQYEGSENHGRLLLQGAGAYIGPTLYLTNGTIIASDRDLKHDIEYDIEVYDAVFDGLKPSRFKYNDGTSDRYHTALIAQDVKDAVLSAGLTTQDFAGYCEVPVYAKNENGHQTDEIIGSSCALRYDEFIALCIRQIQLLKARVAELEEKTA